MKRSIKAYLNRQKIPYNSKGDRVLCHVTNMTSVQFKSLMRIDQVDHNTKLVII